MYILHFLDSNQIHEFPPVKIMFSTLTYPEISIWGNIVVFNSPDEALQSLSEEEKREQYIRLVKIASNRQLKATLIPSKELCQLTASLYLRLDNTCPFYHITWERH